MNERKDAQMKEKSKKKLRDTFLTTKGWVGDCVREEGDACVVALCKEAI